MTILKLLNRIKFEQVYPEVLELCDITSIWKRRGCRNRFDNYRGIFRVTVFRSILDRLIYNDEYSTIDSNLTDSNVGARKGRNIRDNIFVVNAVINSITKGNQEPVDIQLFDEAGLNNDKLPLLFLENQNAHVAVKTPNGLSPRVNIQNIVMQGSVWGSLFCTTTMDKLGQLAYENSELLYMYKGLVSVPPICMVDDILSVQKCSETGGINATINAFIESKKLTLSNRKCNRIHIGKHVNACQELKVHSEKMNESDQEKYLGDQIHKSGKTKATISDRVAKGFGIISEIQAILNEAPLGSYKVEMGFELRQAMLLNGILFNSEAWHSVTAEDITALEKVDEALLRYLGGHAKAPIEMLYLESGATPIRFIIASRRMNYFQTIIKRDEEELTKRILKAQIAEPTPGDFIKLAEDDFKLIDVPFDISFIENSSVDYYKNFIKGKLKTAALKYLQNIQQKHTKVMDIKFDELKPQPYLTSPLFNNEETTLLFALRTRTLRNMKANFKNQYGGKVDCQMKCWEQEALPPEDSQQHLLVCKVLRNKVTSPDIARGDILYKHIFGNISEQKEVTVLLQRLVQAREDILNETPIRTGDILDPSMSNCLCYSDTLFTTLCINCVAIGN